MDCREVIVSESFADFIVETFPDFLNYGEGLASECSKLAGLDYAFIYRSINNIIGNGLAEYSYEEIPKLYGIMDSAAIDSTGALRLQNIPGLELDGSGIIVGIIDNGIDAYHEAFRLFNGNTRIISAWNQADQSLETPIDFEYGSQLDQTLINEELRKDNSDILRNLAEGSTHGTFVTGLAAGNINTEQSFASPAPNADIVVVKLKPAKEYLKNYFFLNPEAVAYQENDIINAVIYINKIANSFEKPVIICLPLGSNQGGHSGLSVLGDFLNSYGSRTGVGIVCANGNEGNSRHHYQGNIAKAEDYDDVQIRVGPNNTGFGMELWGQSPDIFEIEVISPTGERIKRVQSSIENVQTYRLLFEKSVIYIKYELVERKTGQELIQVRIETPTEGVWTLRVYGALIVSGIFNVWLPITEFVGEDTYFLKPDPFITLTSPADTFIPISVGAYNIENEGLYINSGRGYPTDMTVKPTFNAPGVSVLGPSAGVINNPDGINRNYIRLSGTSAAAAITAGVMAQFMEWGIVKGNQVNMNTTEIKNYLIRGAERKATLSYPNRDWGFGILDAYNSINILRM